MILYLKTTSRQQADEFCSVASCRVGNRVHKGPIRPRQEQVCQETQIAFPSLIYRILDSESLLPEVRYYLWINNN